MMKRIHLAQVEVGTLATDLGREDVLGPDLGRGLGFASGRHVWVEWKRKTSRRLRMSRLDLSSQQP